MPSEVYAEINVAASAAMRKWFWFWLRRPPLSAGRDPELLHHFQRRPFLPSTEPLRCPPRVSYCLCYADKTTLSSEAMCLRALYPAAGGPKSIRLSAIWISDPTSCTGALARIRCQSDGINLCDGIERRRDNGQKAHRPQSTIATERQGYSYSRNRSFWEHTKTT